MESLLFRDRLTLAAVLGAGVVVGVSSVYVYLKYSRTLSRDLNHLTRTIEHLDKEIQELKSSRWVTNHAPSSGGSFHTATAANSTSCSVKSKRRSSSGADSCLSHVGSSDDIDEYYDVAEESEINHSFANLNGEITTSIKEDDLNQLFDKVDRLFQGDAGEQQEAYDLLIELKEEHEGNAGLMWRLAVACYQLSTIHAEDAERKKGLVFEGLKYATVALACDDTLGEAHKWYAALLGKATDYYGIQEKIKNGYTFKEHVDIAIRYLPQDRGLYFMRGRWCYEVSMLSWVERKVASTLFATPPTSTFAESREQFLEVERLYPKQWKENLLFIAKCYIGERNYSESIRWLEEARDLECKNSEEKEVHAEVLTLLKKYESYRVK